MKAVVFRQGELAVDQVPDPVPAAGQVPIKVLSCGICGSDLHFVHHAPHVVSIYDRIGSAFPIDLTRDIVLGHEYCGETMERGRGPDALPAGTPVCSVPFTFAEGRAQTVGFSADRPGGYGEYMVLNEANLLPVPNGLSATHAALTEPMAVGWHAVQRARIAREDVPLVLGCGPIGLAVIAALKVLGIHPIVAADFNAARRATAEAMGADVVIDPAERSPYDAWAALARPEGYDPRSLGAIFGFGPQPRPTVIFECVGVPGMIQRACEGALPGTRVVVVGVCMESDRIEPLYPLTRENDLIFCFFYGKDDFARSLHNIAEGLIDVSPLVSRTIGLDGVIDAFADLSAGSQNIKIIVDPWA